MFTCTKIFDAAALHSYRAPNQRWTGAGAKDAPGCFSHANVPACACCREAAAAGPAPELAQRGDDAKQQAQKRRKLQRQPITERVVGPVSVRVLDPRQQLPASGEAVHSSASDLQPRGSTSARVSLFYSEQSAKL